MALIDNLVSYYKLDDNAANTDVNDSTDTNEGTLVGGETTAGVSVAGKINTAFEFDGNDYINIGTMGTFGADMAGGITFATWIKTTTTTLSIRLMGSLNDGDNTLLDIRLNADSAEANDLGKIGVTMRDEDNSLLRAGTTNDEIWRDGNWHFLVIKIDCPGNTVEILIDDDSKPITYTTQTTPDNFVNFEYDMILGARNVRGSIVQYYEGILDEVGIWNKYMSEAESTELWNEGAGLTYPFAPVGTNMKINIGDVWKDIDNLKINIGDAWKNVIKIQQNIGDVWKTVFG